MAECSVHQTFTRQNRNSSNISRGNEPTFALGRLKSAVPRRLQFSIENLYFLPFLVEEALIHTRPPFRVRLLKAESIALVLRVD